MCGIAGWYDNNLDLRDAGAILEEMGNTLARRGPDDSGVFIDGGLGLVHRRLAVIDVNNGHQPMTRKRGEDEYTIVYNGELYNTDELRNELKKLGYRFETRTDTEVVLMSFIEWGAGCTNRLNGIFAFAVWEHSRKRLFLARDRIGVKPLFFYRYSTGLIFASELKAILKNPMVRTEIDEQGLTELFLIGPGRSCGQGVFKGTEELLPGEYAVYDGNTMKFTRYFRLTAHEHDSDEKKSMEEIRELLTDSIERQLVSDVPLCCFLSGGLDSSIISYVASEYNRRNGLPPIDTYSVDYNDNDRYFQKSLFQPTPDSEFIDVMVNAIGSCHHSVVIDNYDLYRALTEAVDARDLPGMVDVDSSLLLFCRKMKEDFTVALSGECADELFGGYPWYHNEKELFEDSFPWSRSLDIRYSILKKGFLPHGRDYVRQRYLDTCRSTDKLPTDSETEARMREMFSLNFYWFMQTLLDIRDIREKYFHKVVCYV